MASREFDDRVKPGRIRLVDEVLKLATADGDQQFVKALSQLRNEIASLKYDPDSLVRCENDIPRDLRIDCLIESFFPPPHKWYRMAEECITRKLKEINDELSNWRLFGSRDDILN